MEYEQLLKGLDDVFFMPHSRHTTIDEDAVKGVDGLELLASSDKAGAAILKSADNRFFFITGHAEYDRETLLYEYERDLAKGMKIEKPENYIDADGKVNMSWASTANLLYVNWLNYYVYQITPFDIEMVK